MLGAAGIGKSRLLQEFTERAALRDAAPAVYRGRCLATGRGITYWALGEMLRSAFGIALDDAAEEAAGRVHAGVRAAMAGSGASDEVVRITAAALAATAGLPLAGGPLESAGARGGRRPDRPRVAEVRHRARRRAGRRSSCSRTSTGRTTNSWRSCG